MHQQQYFITLQLNLNLCPQLAVLIKAGQDIHSKNYR